MAEQKGAASGEKERYLVDGGGKGLSEGRRTASPSIRAYSRPEFPTRILRRRKIA